MRIREVHKQILLVLTLIVAIETFFLVDLEKGHFVHGGTHSQSIVFDTSGFHPEKLTIHQGDQIVFQNKSDHPFWPASDPHPTHDIYPVFDPKGPVSAGQSWSFVFNRPGVWKFHDHLASDMVGEITVLDANGKVLRTECSNKNKNTTECFEADVNAALNQKGLDSALDRMADLYDSEPSFSGSCHSVAHELGKSAYHLFANGEKIKLSGKTSYCSFGFYHGFMEELLQRSGDFDEARSFCAEAGKTLASESSNAEGACYHGIGHGVVDGSDPGNFGDAKGIVDPGLKLCEKVDPTEPHFYRCASGAFNSLAIMLARGEQGLEVKDGNPFAVCDAWTEYNIKNPCYQEMNTLAMKVADRNFSKGIALVEKIPEARYAVLAMRSFSGVVPASFSGSSTQNFQKVIAACHATRADLVIPCIQGIPSGIMEFGTPGKEYEPALKFCATDSLSEEEKVECRDVVFGGIRAYYSKEKQHTICSSVGDVYKSSCLNP